MADVSRRGFLGFLSLLPIAGKATAPAAVEPKPFKFYGLFLKVPAYVTDRTAWLRHNTSLLAPSQGAVSFVMPCCKRKMRYTAIRTIPTKTVPCPCGTPDRWIAFWEVDASALPPVCKTCKGTKLICVPIRPTPIDWGYNAGTWPVPSTRTYLQKDCPDCAEMKPRKGSF